MTPDECRESYISILNEIGEEVTIKRYLGTGNNRPKFEIKVRARVMNYLPVELIGTIIQGDQKLIILADDFLTYQFALPLIKNDKVIVRNKELNIEAVDGNTRRILGELIAYEIQVRG